ncbi:MAG: DUF1553 domain-containing protein [Acidobacteria bacterium]|nr:DUF1553 domain-containing protein [Acidobacteriota bacterium]
MRAMPFLVLLSLAAKADDGTDFFEKNIRPVLAAQCYACHSRDSKPQALGGLFLDSKEGMLRGGKSGVPAIVPGKPEDSVLLTAIQHKSKDLKMPPGRPLAPEVVRAFETWIKMGAPDPRTGAAPPAEQAAYDWEKARRHWAYQPVRDPAAPVVASPEWSRTEVDRFVKAKLDEKGLKPLGPAAREALLRRATFDLTGLPPAPADVRRFLADRSPDAFERVVDRLLDSQAYGEHWGRHWLDLVRYADTAGDASDFPVPELYRYRNYVIRSIREGKAMDLFIREQLAGDLMKHRDEEDRREKIVATGYVALSRRFGQSMSEHFLTVDDTVDNLGKVFLGLSVGCARCHDHKFDAIPSRDYYALTGIFESTNYAHAGMEHNQYLQHFSPLDSADAGRLKRTLDRMEDLHRIVKKDAGPPAGPPEKQLEYYKASEEFLRLRQNFPNIPMVFAVQDGKAQQARILLKGDPQAKGPEVPRGFPQVIGGAFPAGHEGSGRDLLADWLLAKENPLTVRVLVNRLWLWHFGRGLVDSPNDFGVRGERPTHPELLDYLASRFVADGWSLKKFHKRVMLTRVYQMASGADAENLTRDPKNASYWRFDRRRLAAEEVRDTLLAASGQLDSSMGGAHPFPPRGTYTFTQHRPFVGDLAQFDTNRRSVYLMQQRFRRHPYLELFDGPDPNNTTASRATNTTALQSLYFMNSEFVHKQADALAVRTALAGTTDREAVALAYRLLYAREATAAELAEAGRFLAAAAVQLNEATPAEERRRAALGSLMRTLVASNEFFYVD